MLKDYSNLYKQHAGDATWTEPTHSEKKNAFGEIWMRIKNHPFAFPAFDLRDGYDDVSQYNVLSSMSSGNSPLNKYFSEIDDYLRANDGRSGLEWLSCTIDTIGLSSLTSKKQHLRCFFDMELDPTHRSMLLATPFYTGSSHLTVWNRCEPKQELMTYANSSILVSFLDVQFDYNNDIYVYTCANDVYRDDIANVNINNIANKHMLVYGVPKDSTTGIKEICTADRILNKTSDVLT